MARYHPGAALIVVDVQNDFADPSGSLSVRGGPIWCPTINREIAAAREQRRHRRPHPGLAPGAAPRTSRRTADLAGPLRRGHLGRGAPPGARRPPRAGRPQGQQRRGRLLRLHDARLDDRRDDPDTAHALLQSAGITDVVVTGLATDYCVEGDRPRRASAGLRDHRPDRRLRDRRPAPGDGEAALEDLRNAGVSSGRADALTVNASPLLVSPQPRPWAPGVADRWLAGRRGDEPLPPIEMLAVVDAPIEAVWAVVADVPRQLEWMRDMKSLRIDTPGAIGVGTRAEATVRVLGIPVPDPVVIVEFEPPIRYAIRHLGAFEGDGLFTLEPGADGTTTIVALGGATRAAGAAGPRHAAPGPDPASRVPGRPRAHEAARRDRLGGRLKTDAVQLHLVDATYELFRAHFAPRPPVLGRDGILLSGVSGLVEQLLYLLREQGATHVGCATDRVIARSATTSTRATRPSAGMPPELLDQFPVAEDAIEALGVVLWPMVEFEADDAIGAAAEQIRRGPADRADRDLHARTRTWRSASATSGSSSGIAVATSPTTTPASGRSGASRPRASRTAWRSSATPPTATRAPRLGRQDGLGRARAVWPFRADPGTRQRLGRQGAPEPRRPRADAARPDGGRAPVPRPRPASHDRRRRRDPAGGRRRARVARCGSGAVGGLLRRVGARPAAREAAPLALGERGAAAEHPLDARPQARRLRGRLGGAGFRGRWSRRCGSLRGGRGSGCRSRRRGRRCGA